MKITEYVEGPWLAFSSQNNLRSLPSIKDGLVSTSRKLVYSLSGVKDFEVIERLGLKAAAETAYKHAGTSISNSLTGMVKDFPGTNNVPLFEGEGQFGTAIDNEASAARYISARIAPIFSKIFIKEDLPILPRRVERGETLEPHWMAPVIPMALVNGAFGIGTGFACNIYQHNPIDVIDAIMETLNTGGITKPLIPWWRGWKGTVEPDANNQNRFTLTGKFERVNATELRITELPISMNNARYQAKVLNPMLDDNDDVLSIDNDSNKFDGWNITVKFKRGVLSKKTDEEIINEFALRETISHVLALWGTDDKITQYENIQEMLNSWIDWRLDVYEDRRQYQLKDLQEQLEYERMKVACVEMVVNNGRPISEDQIITKFGEGPHIERLMSIPLRGFTHEGMTRSMARISSLEGSITKLKNTDSDQLMVSELAELKKIFLADFTFKK